MPKQTFGPAIKQLRRQARRTMQEAGDHVGYSISYITDIESGRREPFHPHLVRKLCIFYDAPDRVDEFCMLAAQGRTWMKMPTHDAGLCRLCVKLLLGIEAGTLETKTVKQMLRIIEESEAQAAI